MTEGPLAGEGDSPGLTLDGFSGPLDHLLALARAQEINLADISLTALVDQLATALRQAPAAIPLGQKGDWVVMAAWLVQLRSRLLLPADALARQDAAGEADQLRMRLGALQAMQALAGWLEQRPRLGHDVFARGRPPWCAQSPHPRAWYPPSRARTPEISVEVGPLVDVVEFLWASLALFDDEDSPEMATAYQLRLPALHTVAQARDRILRRLEANPDGAPLAQLLPDESPDAGDAPRRVLRRRSGWAATFVAGLELAKQGNVVMEQEGMFQPIHLTKT